MTTYNSTQCQWLLEILVQWLVINRGVAIQWGYLHIQGANKDKKDYCATITSPLNN